MFRANDSTASQPEANTHNKNSTALKKKKGGGGCGSWDSNTKVFGGLLNEDHQTCDLWPDFPLNFPKTIQAAWLIMSLLTTSADRYTHRHISFHWPAMLSCVLFSILKNGGDLWMGERVKWEQPANFLLFRADVPHCRCEHRWGFECIRRQVQ